MFVYQDERVMQAEGRCPSAQAGVGRKAGLRNVSRRGAWRRGAVGAAAVVLVATSIAACGGGSARTSPSAAPAAGSQPSPPAQVHGGLSVLWSAPASAAESGSNSWGAWVGADQTVVAMTSVVAAYRSQTGQSTWTWRPPSGSVCNASDTAVDGIGVVAFAQGSQCDHFIAVNTATGKSAWSGPDVGTLDGISGGVVIATGQYGTVAAYQLSSGVKLWSSDTDQALVAAECIAYNSALDTTDLYVDLQCGSGKHGYALLVDFDPATGAHRSAVHVSGGSCESPGDDYQGDAAQITPPFYAFDGGRLVVDCAPAGAQAVRPGQVFALSAATGAVYPMDVESQGFDPIGIPTPGFSATGFFVENAGTFYLTTPGRLDAFDLANGRLLWSVARPAGVLQLIAATGAGAEGLLCSGQNWVCTIANYQAADGKQTLGTPITGGEAYFKQAGPLLADGSTLTVLPQGEPDQGTPVISRFSMK